MVRVYSQPTGYSTLGGMFGEEPPRRAEYEDSFEMKRRDHRNSGYDHGGMRASASESHLNLSGGRERGDTSLQKQIDSLSDQLSRLRDYGDPGYNQSKSYPTSAQFQSSEQSRKTWSAPNKDPFGPRSDLTNLADPMARRSQEPQSGRSYVPSFGSGSEPRGRRRGGGNDPPPPVNGKEYIRQLQEQMEEQQRKKASEDTRDWWEKAPPHYQVEPEKPAPGKRRQTRRDNQHNYEQELREQVEERKRIQDEIKRKEREEEEKIERRAREQQEKIQREFEEEQAAKKAKEQAKLQRQEELMRRQQQLQEEMEQKRKAENERRMAEKRGNRDANNTPVNHRHRHEQEQRIASPPIPTLQGSSSGEGRRSSRSRSRGPPPDTAASRRENGAGEAEDDNGSGVVQQLQTMRRGLERRHRQFQDEEDEYLE